MINPEKKKKWTLMFFFASDNTLSPSTLSQLKQIKAAGFQANTNVIVYLDPNEKGAPTRVFQINKENKVGPESQSSGDSDGLVSVLVEDNISPAEIGKSGPESRNFASSLQNVNQLEAHTALKQFLSFCRENYPAEHYMLFLVGHGLVVGRDAFLSDDNPDSAIGLRTLGEIMQEFSREIRNQREVLELIGMHSCSMSAIEVAYQLKGTANYMLASEGLSFVGSWPYRQLLSRIYAAINNSTDNNVLELVKGLHFLCIHHSVDFMYAGYSSDLCLCSLDPERIDTLTEPISTLAKALKEGLEEDRCGELVVLAHWKSQSYWQETYSDLYDFCLCLRRLCERELEKRNQRTDNNGTSLICVRESDVKLKAIIEACAKIVENLTPPNGHPVDGPIVCTDYIGPDCQYSHGFSIYFPWSKPSEDANDRVLENYQNYFFTTATNPGAVSWWEFLNSYFKKTEREDRLKEDKNLAAIYETDPAYKRALDAARVTFDAALSLGARDVTPTSALEGKISPPDSGGGACSCASTKNYSRLFSMSHGAATIIPATVTTTTAATAIRSKRTQRRSRGAGR